jgi:hypothetical protein
MSFEPPEPTLRMVQPSTDQHLARIYGSQKSAGVAHGVTSPQSPGNGRWCVLRFGLSFWAVRASTKRMGEAP